MSNDRIGFSTSNQLISRAIRWFTKSETSHVFFIYYDEDFKGDFVFEATEPEVRIFPWPAFKKENTIVDVFIPLYPLDKGFEAMGQRLGYHYNFWGLIGMIWVLIGRLLGYQWRNPLTSKKAEFCSEGVSYVLLWSNYPGFDGIPDTKDPQQLLEFCRKNMLKLKE
jgi:hypothetical protein